MVRCIMDWILLSLLIFWTVVLVVVLFWRFWFLRLPARTIPLRGIVSPASGKLVRIISYRNGQAQNIPKGLFGMVHALTSDVAKEGYLLVIMLTPMDVHYQRAPASGTVLATTYSPGKFANAVSGAANLHAFENEKNEILFAVGKERLKVVQVAGFLARRIESAVTVEQRVSKGDVIGLINLGSQVLLVMPKKRLLVKEGQMMTDGETVIAV